MGEVISGAVLAALGVYIFVQSRAYDYYTPDGPGPGFFPLWYGVAMVVLSLALIVSQRPQGRRRAAASTGAAIGRALGDLGGVRGVGRAHHARLRGELRAADLLRRRRHVPALAARPRRSPLSRRRWPSTWCSRSPWSVQLPIGVLGF